MRRQLGDLVAEPIQLRGGLQGGGTAVEAMSPQMLTCTRPLGVNSMPLRNWSYVVDVLNIAFSTSGE